MKQKNAVTTQPNWGVIVLSLFMLYILLDSSYQEYGDFSGIFKDIRVLIMLALVIFSLVAGRHYTFYNTHIIIRLYVPYKIGKLQIQGFSEPATPKNKITELSHYAEGRPVKTTGGFFAWKARKEAKIF